VACHDFLPFGEEISSGSSGYGGRTATCFTEAGSTTDGTAQRFTGKERDAELAGSAMQGLDYFGARYFSGAQGRWTSPDPSSAGLNIANPQSWNLYNYVLNNPLRLVDNNGLWATDVHAQIVTYSLQQYVSAGELNTLRARQYSMDADQSDQIRHAMANQGQSSLDALNAMWQFVASQMGVASQNVGSGGALDATGIGALGAAIHTVEDYTSPMHTDSNFMPLVWTGGYWPPSKWGSGLAHVNGEASPDQDWARMVKRRLFLPRSIQKVISCDAETLRTELHPCKRHGVGATFVFLYLLIRDTHHFGQAVLREPSHEAELTQPLPHLRVHRFRTSAHSAYSLRGDSATAPSALARGLT